MTHRGRFESGLKGCSLGGLNPCFDVSRGSINSWPPWGFPDMQISGHGPAIVSARDGILMMPIRNVNLEGGRGWGGVAVELLMSANVGC